MSSLDLKSGCFQLTVSPSDIVKTAFVTKYATYAFRCMPVGLSGAAPNFQKSTDLILKPVIGKFVNVYMDDVIISSPSFTHHVEHLREVFDYYKRQAKTPEILLVNRGAEGIRRGQGGDNESASFKIAGFQKTFLVIYGCLFNRWVLKLAEFNIKWKHRSGAQNAVTDVLSRNPVESIIGEKVNCAIIRDLVLSSREQLIEEQRKDRELGHLYRYLEIPEYSSVTTTICKTDKHGPLIISPPGSWSEPNRKLKRGRKDTLVYKRSPDYGSGGAERTQRKGQKYKGEKRQLALSSNNELQCPRKRNRGDEIVMHGTSGYNLRPRRGAKVESRPTNEMRTQKKSTSLSQKKPRTSLQPLH
ncbi:uncharacterized protein TNCV_551341 [Trichonephila clavipes]|nr:uncharacterized protein TNCV_551341 [Trichonephila clavipes]